MEKDRQNLISKVSFPLLGLFLPSQTAEKTLFFPLKIRDMNNEAIDIESLLEEELSRLSAELEQDARREEIRRKRAEGGKKGGRPVLTKKREIKKFFRINEIEQRHITEVSSAWGVSESEYLRRCATGVAMPDAERNKILSMCHTNFKRISNIFRRDMWDEEEKEQFRKELSEAIHLIKSNLK